MTPLVVVLGVVAWVGLGLLGGGWIIADTHGEGPKCFHWPSVRIRMVALCAMFGPVLAFTALVSTGAEHGWSWFPERRRS